MWLMNLLKLFPMSVSVTLFYLYLSIALLIRFVLTNVIGLLILAVFVWLMAPSALGVTPMHLGELVLFVDALPEGYKVGIVTALLTVLGFLISFAVGIHNWRVQQYTQLQLNSADDIERFVAEASPHINTLTYTCERALDLIERLHGEGDAASKQFALKYWLSRVPEATAARSELSKMSVAIHRLTGKHFGIFGTMWGAIATFQTIVDAFTHLSRETWKIQLPPIPSDDPAAERLFLQWTNADDYRTFLREARLNSDLIHGLSGSLRGQLQASVTAFNLTSLMHLYGQRQNYRRYLEAMQAGEAALRSRRSAHN
jgi:hypothetical protein